MIKLTDATKIGHLIDKLKSARGDRDALSGMTVVGVLLARDKGVIDPIELSYKNKHGGGGSITGIGFPEELQLQLVEGVQAFASVRVKAIEAELVKLGVDPGGE